MYQAWTLAVQNLVGSLRQAQKASEMLDPHRNPVPTGALPFPAAKRKNFHKNKTKSKSTAKREYI